MSERTPTAPERAYQSAAIKRQRGVLEDLDGVEHLITDAADAAMTEIARDAIAGRLSVHSVTMVLDALDRRYEQIIGDSLGTLSSDWWSSCLDLWAAACEKDPRIVPALAYRPKAAILEDAGELLATLAKLFDAPSKSATLKILNAPVNGIPWRQRIKTARQKAVTPQGLAKAIAEAYSSGANIDGLTTAIRPLIADTAASARRIARTEGIRIANTLHEDAMDQAGEVVIGYTYVATLDDVTRPAHAARNGRVFKKGEPRVSLPDGPNCRCIYTPILETDVKVFGRPGSIPPEARRVEEFAKWFNDAPPAKRVAIVGDAAYKKAAEKFGNPKPTWEQVTSATVTLEVERIRGELETARSAVKARRGAA